MNFKGLSVLLSTAFLVLFFSCTKINESTELGSDLIPAVDNVHTFDTTLNLQTAYHFFNDTTKTLISDYMALGQTTDPAFGTSKADMYFTLSSSAYGTYPFKTAYPNNTDSLKIDSVVLSLAYKGSYGDTTSLINVSVSEVTSPTANFNDTTLYRFDNGSIATGSVLGSKTFALQNLKDSILVGRRPSDTAVKVANVLRIRLNNSIAQKLISFDTSSTSGKGGYYSDSTFRLLFRGLAVKATSASGNGAFGYFNLYDNANTQLIVYFRSTVNNVTDTTSATFVHSAYSQINSIQRTAGGQFLANLNALNPQQLYVQSSPAGSYIGIKIPGLDAFPNKVIHRAEIIAYKVPDATGVDNIFTPPSRLLLDRRVPSSASDSAYSFENDLQVGSDGSLNFAAFGGTLGTDNAYRFNITRYVQGIVTRKERNDSLRLYAPLRSNLFAKNLNQYISVPNLTYVGSGRVILYGPTVANPATRLRLRIIYSNL